MDTEKINFRTDAKYVDVIREAMFKFNYENMSSLIIAAVKKGLKSSSVKVLPRDETHEKEVIMTIRFPVKLIKELEKRGNISKTIRYFSLLGIAEANAKYKPVAPLKLDMSADNCINVIEMEQEIQEEIKKRSQELKYA